MTKHLIAIFITTCVVGSCAPVTISPTKQPTASFTQTTIPSATPTELPSPTPIPETQERLLVTRDHEHWALLNADGSLQKYIQIPDLADPSEVSPDGNWLAYQAGSYEEPYNLSLNLLNLDNESSQLVSHLVSPDFPDNIGPVVETMSQYDPSVYGDDCADVECRRSLVEDELLSTLGRSRWSPDGQFLAFTAQIDGPSTDIYVYRMEDKTIRRLTDDLRNVEWIDWSPDGKRLLYTNDIPGILHTGRTFHVTDLEGRTFELSQEILIKDSQWYTHGWISDDLYLLQALYPEPGQRHFRQLVVVNTGDGKLREIWPYHTDEVVIDTNNQRIILSFSLYSFDDPIPNAPEPGTYFISTEGDRKRISTRVFSLLPDSVQIMGENEEDRAIYHILSDGSARRIGAGIWGLASSSSPNQKWFFLEQGEYEGRYRVSLYSDNYKHIKSWMFDGDVLYASWRPDSLGIFLFTSSSIYYLAIPDGEPQLLHVEVPPLLEEGCDPVICSWPSFAWRP